MSYIKFTESGTSPSGKTKRWTVESVAGGPVLGTVRWYAPWRKYTFQTTESIFDSTCLQEITDFIESETEKHK
jgi:hypothetical protein